MPSESVISTIQGKSQQKQKDFKGPLNSSNQCQLDLSHIATYEESLEIEQRKKSQKIQLFKVRIMGPYTYQLQILNNVFVERFVVLVDPTSKRYKEQEHKRSEFMPTVKQDQIRTAMHIFRSLRIYQADQILQE